MSISSLAKDCDKQNIPGTTANIYLQMQSAFAGFPAEGATPKVLEGAYSFNIAPAPQGFEGIPIIPDTGGIDEALAGESAGTKGIISSFKFTIKGNSAERAKFADDMLRYDGCGIAVIKLRNGERRQFGNQDIPVQIRSIALSSGMKSGEANQGVYEAFVDTGLTAPFLDEAVALPIL